VGRWFAIVWDTPYVVISFLPESHPLERILHDNRFDILIRSVDTKICTLIWFCNRDDSCLEKFVEIDNTRNFKVIFLSYSIEREKYLSIFGQSYK